MGIPASGGAVGPSAEAGLLSAPGVLAAPRRDRVRRREALYKAAPWHWGGQAVPYSSASHLGPSAVPRSLSYDFSWTPGRGVQSHDETTSEERNPRSSDQNPARHRPFSSRCVSSAKLDVFQCRCGLIGSGLGDRVHGVLHVRWHRVSAGSPSVVDRQRASAMSGFYLAAATLAASACPA